MLARAAVQAVRRCRVGRARALQLLLPGTRVSSRRHSAAAAAPAAAPTKVINTGSAYEQLMRGGECGAVAVLALGSPGG